MILSERELALGDDHAGILVLDPDAPVGVDFTELVALPDVIFDLEITSNRPDAMSMVGIARDLGAITTSPTHSPMDPPTSGDALQSHGPDRGSHRLLSLRGRELRGARRAIAILVTPALPGSRGPADLQRCRHDQLRDAGAGQPLHAFDLDKVTDESIIVRRAQPGEKLVTLDGVERALIPDDLVVADAVKASGLAGTMGGEESEVSATTKRVLIEAAAWDPPTIMYMSRRHGLLSEASRRFERGVDPNLPPDAAAPGGQVDGGTDRGEPRRRHTSTRSPGRLSRPKIQLRLSEVTRILGRRCSCIRGGALVQAVASRRGRVRSADSHRADVSAGSGSARRPR